MTALYETQNYFIKLGRPLLQPSVESDVYQIVNKSDMFELLLEHNSNIHIDEFPMSEAELADRLERLKQLRVSNFNRTNKNYLNRFKKKILITYFKLFSKNRVRKNNN